MCLSWARVWYPVQYLPLLMMIPSWVQTIALRECMLAHRDYYQPLLDEEEKEMSKQELEEGREEEIEDPSHED